MAQDTDFEARSVPGSLRSTGPAAASAANRMVLSHYRTANDTGAMVANTGQLAAQV